MSSEEHHTKLLSELISMNNLKLNFPKPSIKGLRRCKTFKFMTEPYKLNNMNPQLRRINNLQMMAFLLH